MRGSNVRRCADPTQGLTFVYLGLRYRWGQVGLGGLIRATLGSRLTDFLHGVADQCFAELVQVGWIAVCHPDSELAFVVAALRVFFTYLSIAHPATP